MNLITINVFSLWTGKLMNYIGQFIDAFLFIYLVNGFFYPKKDLQLSRKKNILSTLLLTFLFSIVLLLVDFIFSNNFYGYYITILLIPLIYSILFFRDKLITKIIICFLFTTMIISIEQLVIQFPFRHFHEETEFQALFWFFQRRISIKILLFIGIKKLLFWPKESNIQLPTPCWLIFLFISVGNTILLVFFRLPISDMNPLSVSVFPDYPKITQLITLLVLTALPFALMLLMKYLAITAEKNRIISAQIAQSRVQNQYLVQQVEMTESLRKFRHDYKAHLFCMDTLLSAQKYDELHQYLLSLHQYQYEGIHLRRFTDDESINIILNQKISVAEKYGIEFQTDIFLPTSGKISIADLNSLLVNLCDNAIEACATLSDAKIILNIKKIKAYLLIDITNTCDQNVRQINPNLLTSKSNPEYHGMGLKIIKSITEKYHGQYHISCDDHSFTINLMLLDD